MPDILGNEPKPNDYIAYFFCDSSFQGLSLGIVEYLTEKTLRFKSRRESRKYMNSVHAKFRIKGEDEIAFSRLNHSNIKHSANYFILTQTDNPGNSENLLGHDFLGNEVFEGDMMAVPITEEAGRFPKRGLGLIRAKRNTNNRIHGDLVCARIQQVTHNVELIKKDPWGFRQYRDAIGNRRYISYNSQKCINTNSPQDNLLMNKLSGFFDET